MIACLFQALKKNNQLDLRLTCGYLQRRTLPCMPHPVPTLLTRAQVLCKAALDCCREATDSELDTTPAR